MTSPRFHSEKPFTLCSTNTLRLIFLSLITLLQGCSQSSPEIFYRTAQQMGLQRHVIEGKGFPLVYYSKGSIAQNRHLHLYLGGDGLPWKNIITYSEDPTPRNPLVLKLMKQDNNPGIYLGRPCYQGFSRRTPCNYRYWTSARYSTEVIDAMTQAVKKIIKIYHIQSITVIGYSGGGTIALLISNSIPEIKMVITIAGNLDTDAWTKYHYYSALSESLNPALQQPLLPQIRQIHLQGKLDKNIPAKLSARFLKRQTNALTLKYPSADHACCWHQYWPKVLDFIHSDTTDFKIK
ncbi:MAG: alpha/beta hydrolase [Gammaproteobacteria bacterium]|nr:alpha/beta hydrolase [Gammaproteobacteria bacterium]